jgi:peptidoglycan-associated lipoprotein
MKSIHYLFALGVSLSLNQLGCSSKPEEAAPAAEVKDTTNSNTSNEAPVATDPAPPAITNDPIPPSSEPPLASAPATGLETIYFDFDSYTINAGAQTTLRNIAASLKSQGQAKIQIEGHCDERGSNEYNLALGERRARAIQEFLVSEGLSASSLSTISYGEERPSIQGSGEDAWAKNRRGEFKPL